MMKITIVQMSKHSLCDDLDDDEDDEDTNICWVQRLTVWLRKYMCPNICVQIYGPNICVQIYGPNIFVQINGSKYTCTNKCCVQTSTHCVAAAIPLQRRHSPIPNLSNDNNDNNPKPDKGIIIIWRDLLNNIVGPILNT